ncbi:hypothetical protein [Brevundimonas viscosa]|uniref:TIGR02588 family protein n=1 Tax=Brevundimonas viscosa TaxID=871741 RepID=A0A1I6NR77_9CAUL|nr:hypothetical protein [Brevundimonas viscosa]SFS30384.1 TIGR02588 family protein [Brevundimonas viscosa]
MAAARKKPGPPPAPALLEWAMGGLGALIVLAVLAVVLVEAIGPRAPAALEARLQSARPAAGRWLAEVEVANTGDRTAAAVEIEGRLGSETATATLDYVPAHGRETVVLTFDADPRGAVNLSVPGWSEP